LARQFFATEVAVEVTALAQDGAPKPAAASTGSPGKPTEERSDMVKEALRIFGGSVRSVRRENG